MNTVICHHSTERFLKELKDFDVCSNPFQSYAFYSVYLKYFQKGNYYYFNIEENNKIIGIIPFECTFESLFLHVKKFRFIGYRDFNYEQYICLDQDMGRIHELFITHLEQQSYSTVLNIYDINSKSSLFPILEKDSRFGTKLQLYTCPCLYFTPDFEAFFKETFSSAKKRTELKKLQRKVSELGNFKIVNVENREGYEAHLNYINQLYKVHSERFADVYATSFFGSERMRPYYSELIKSLMYSNKAYISMLVLDEIVIAFIFCLTNGRVLIDWIPAFDPAFVKYSLGTVQYKMLFEEICHHGKYTMFDYSKGSSVYKRKWAKEETNNYQYLINLSHGNPIACILHIIDKAKFSFKVYLRNKGILNTIKHALGKVLSFIHKDKQAKPNLVIRAVDGQNESDYVFNYSKLNKLPVQTREAILSEIYQGKKIYSVSEEEIVVSK